MTEQENTTQQEPKKGVFNGNEKTLIFLAVCACAFLGGFFAIRTLAHPYLTELKNQSYAYSDENDLMPSDVIKMQTQMINDFVTDMPDAFGSRPATAKKHIKEPKFKNVPQSYKPAPIKIFNNDNGYEIIVDLKEFNNDENNLKFDIKPTSIKADGKYQTEKMTKSYSTYSSFSKKIDPKKAEKTVDNGKLIIKLPYLK